MELRETIKLRMKEYPGRLLHILGVEQMAVKLANLHHVDAHRASIAALLHDVAKKMPLEDMKVIMDREGYDSGVHYKLWHAYVGAYIAKEEFGIVDDEIIEAIEIHPSGKANMSPLAEVLFVADWIEENTRTFDGVEEQRLIAYKDIKRAVAMKFEFLMSKLESPSKDTQEGYEQYKQYLKENTTC